MYNDLLPWGLQASTTDEEALRRLELLREAVAHLAGARRRAPKREQEVREALTACWMDERWPEEQLLLEVQPLGYTRAMLRELIAQSLVQEARDEDAYHEQYSYRD